MGLFLFFVFSCVRASILLRAQMGLFTSIVFVAGLLSFIARPPDDGRVNALVKPATKGWVSPVNDGLDRNFSTRNVSLEKTAGLDLDLLISYGQHKTTNQKIPYRAVTFTTGFTGGLVWRPDVITIQPTNDSALFAYYVTGFLYWKLLGKTVYTQQKRYKGVVEAP